MQVIRLPEQPVRLSFDTGHRMTKEEYLAFCRDNPDLRVERSAEGEIVVMPPAGAESSFRNATLTTQLCPWAQADGRGVCFDSSAQFPLPDGSALSPDAAWVSLASLRRHTPQQRKEFLPLCPEFVVEVRSPSDRLPQARKKMEQWIANGAELAWLIDGDRETVYIYRKGEAPRTRKGIKKLAGEGPLEGFVLELSSIWAGLA